MGLFDGTIEKFGKKLVVILEQSSDQWRDYSDRLIPPGQVPNQEQLENKVVSRAVYTTLRIMAGVIREVTKDE